MQSQAQITRAAHPKLNCECYQNYYRYLELHYILGCLGCISVTIIHEMPPNRFSYNLRTYNKSLLSEDLFDYILGISMQPRISSLGRCVR